MKYSAGFTQTVNKVLSLLQQVRMRNPPNNLRFRDKNGQNEKCFVALMNYYCFFKEFLLVATAMFLLCIFWTGSLDKSSSDSLKSFQFSIFHRTLLGQTFVSALSDAVSWLTNPVSQMVQDNQPVRFQLTLKYE